MTPPAARRRERTRALALLWVAISGLLLIGIVGFALDTGHVLLTAHQLQNAADAASLAGAMNVRLGRDAVNLAALRTAAANDAAGDAVQLAQGGDIIIGRYDRRNRTFQPLTDADLDAGEVGNSVKVIARRSSGSVGGALPLVFGSALGVPTTDVSRFAIAMIAGATGAGMITLCPDCECALDLVGNTALTVEPADGYDGQTAIQVNSVNPTGMCCAGNVTVEAPEVNIVGDSEATCVPPQPPPDVNPRSPEIPDPLASIPPPPCNGPTFATVKKDGTLNQPGNYPNGIEMVSSGEVVNLAPGIYCVDGVGLYVKGGVLNAYEVMFYVKDSTPNDSKESSVKLVGNAIVNITPISNESDTYWGISIFQARDNHNEAKIIGTADMNLQGTLYFPVAPLEVGGTGISLGNQLISWTLRMHGNGTFDIAYDGRFRAPGSKVFLVQ